MILPGCRSTRLRVLLRDLDPGGQRQFLRVHPPILARPHHVPGETMCGTTPARPETARERHRDVDNDPL